MLADVDEDAVALALSVEAGAARAKGDWDPTLAPEPQHLRHILGIPRLHHRPRKTPVRAGVGGISDEVADPIQDTIGGAEQLFQLPPQRRIDSARERVRRPIVNRLTRRRRNRRA